MQRNPELSEEFMLPYGQNILSSLSDELTGNRFLLCDHLSIQRVALFLIQSQEYVIDMENPNIQITKYRHQNFSLFLIKLWMK